MGEIYCVTFEGGPLSDPLRNLLFDTAQEMIDDGKEERTVRASTGKGKVTTEGQQACIGGISGTVFTASLATNRGFVSVTFIVRPTRTWRSKDGRWV